MFVSSRVSRPLLNLRGLVCYSPETPYKVIDIAGKQPFSHYLVFTYAQLQYSGHAHLQSIDRVIQYSYYALSKCLQT